MSICVHRDVIMLYDHEGRVLARQKNGSLVVEPDGNRLFIAADLSNSNAARDLYEDITTGLIDQMSFAFTVADEEYDKKTHTRLITRIKKVYDVSAVSIPANPSTTISARGYAEVKYAAEQLEQLTRRRRILLLRTKMEGTTHA